MPNKKEIDSKIMLTLDNSNFLRGLLLLIRKDKNVWDHEERIFIKAGIEFGFDKEFCKESLQSLLKNEYINNDPPKFFDTEIAKKFLLVGIKVINQDLRPHSEKIKFLETVAENNEIILFWDKIKSEIIYK